MQFSSDRQWFWDGVQWRAAYSPDGRWWWDGRQWVPAGGAPPQRWRYVPTEWTRRLQLIVGAQLILGAVYAIVALPNVLLPMMQQLLDRLATVQSASDPNLDVEQLRATTAVILYTSVGFGVVTSIVSAIVIVIGTIKLWRWLYWYLMIVDLIAVLGIPQQIASALGLWLISVPPAWLLAAIPAALLQTALGVWMLVLLRRHGAWARRRVPA